MQRICIGCCVLFGALGPVAAQSPPGESQQVAVGRETATFRKISPRKYEVDYPDYYLLETEVTNRLFREYLRATGRHKNDAADVAERIRVLTALREAREKPPAPEPVSKITGPVVKPLVTPPKDRSVVHVKVG